MEYTASRGRDAPAQTRAASNGFPLDVKADNSHNSSLHHPHMGTARGFSGVWSNARSSRILGWVAWILSVLVCSAILSSILASAPALQTSWQRPAEASPPSSHGNIGIAGDHMSLHFPRSDMGPVGSARATPVVKRESTCASGDEPVDDYDLPLRIGAVFIILFVSASACAFPLLASKLPGLRMPSDFFFSVRHFGTGVLIATAFCHLLPTAFTLLHDPCLDEFWREGYAAMPGAIALGAVLFVTAIEMWLHPGRHCHEQPPAAEPAVPHNRQKGQFNGRESSIGRHLSFINNGAAPGSRITSSVLSDDPELAAYMKREFQQPAIEEGKVLNTPRDTPLTSPNAINTTFRDHADPSALTPEQKRKRETTQCFLLEMGILFHSVFIGMALSVALGSQFVVLLVAISFHQMFEGLALGSRIAAIDWPKEKSLQPWLMALAYGCTTPLGQAIGLATRSAYSPDSEVGLILVGVMNSISSGLLIFASLVELLSEDLLSDESWKILRGKRRVCAFFLVIAGAFGMSLIGAWA
ncbi:ZIP zinc transporter-domain-containing protein [Microdochium bolleyi]|uniref:ZIP zinc transporter-domain-containing protein n=1 Tax=Microdochium bolleyi TaxID=196109 RepID=A0A136IXS4_9PEZI|nr:ZIP zinc transporter-domain-containing protein [Microdochium bolleyi]